MAKGRTFERSLARLTEIVEALESETTSLADAMKLYEEGITLSQACRLELEQAELKITELRSRADGELAEEASNL
ncbi:MAG: exodeoxyribonuclease VII small subunit [Bacteroidetes bacterium]|nr:exodeoxyribonuclease VII small subunit [Bacteroidota bacterium]